MGFDPAQPTNRRVEALLAGPKSFTRKWPLVFLAASVAVLVGLHSDALNEDGNYPTAVLTMATIAGWSLGGVLYPPFFFAAGKHGKLLPVWNKIAAGLFAAAGFAIGMWMLFALY